MADRTEGIITIDAEPAAIMAVITDFESYPEWADIRGVEIRERGTDGRATKVWFEVQAAAINAKYVLGYDYADGDLGVSWRFLEGTGLKDIQGEYALEPADGSTKVTYRLSVDVNIPGPGFIKRKLLGEGEKRIIDTALKGLKARVEKA